jgi:Fic family protein
MKPTTFIPAHLPLRSLNWDRFIGLLGKAYALIARQDEILKSVPHPASVFSLLTSAEVINSLHSQKVTLSLEELFVCEALDIRPSDCHDEDLAKIAHYRLALQKAARWVIKHPLSLSLLCKIHEDMNRGSKVPKNEIGRFREKQNWIGPKGCSLEEAYFYPPSASTLRRHLGNLKKYIAYQEKDTLVQLAIFFAQLLIIHPFMNGNGRVARSLIPLFLYKKGVVSSPIVYLSAYFKKHRLVYFEKLFLVTSKSDWEEWIRFFLKGVIEEGESTVAKSQRILAVYRKFNEEAGHSIKAKKAIESLFVLPILTKEKWGQLKKGSPSLQRLQKKKWVVPYRSSSLIVVKDLLTIIRF